MGITNPAEPHFRRGIWGWATSAWVKLVATAGGILKVHVAEQTGFLTVRQTVASYLVTSGYGWEGSAWRKLPMLWGYSDRYAEYEVDEGVSAATHTLSFATVPAGEVWVVTQYSARASTIGPGPVVFSATLGGVLHYLSVVPYNFPWMTIEHTGDIILKYNDYLEVTFYTCAAGDNIYAWASGYKMKVAEA